MFDARRPRYRHGSSKLPRNVELAFYERFVDDNFGSHVGQLAFVPEFNLLSRRLEIPLHSLSTNRNAVDQRERLRSAIAEVPF
jgi:hypothetical protein